MNFASFDLNLLRVFDALMNERSATRAGDRLGLSQPAVSAALARLRHACADTLFIRSANEMVPTPRAEDLHGPIRSALAEIERTLAGEGHFDPATATRTFTLMGADFFSSFVVPKLSAAMRKAAPGIVLRFLDIGRGDPARLLRDDLIDAVLQGPLALPDWGVRRVIYHSRFVIIAARKHRELARAGVKPGAKIPLDLFCALPQAIHSVDGTLGGVIDEGLARVGRQRHVVLGTPHFHGLGAAVAAGGLIAAVPVQIARMIAGPMRLAVYEPPVDMPVPEVSIYWHKRRDREPAHVWLREQLIAACAE
jgi:DNA-binding transcriptional LysR family regulator